MFGCDLNSSKNNVNVGQPTVEMIAKWGRTKLLNAQSVQSLKGYFGNFSFSCRYASLPLLVCQYVCERVFYLFFFREEVFYIHELRL